MVDRMFNKIRRFLAIIVALGVALPAWGAGSVDAGRSAYAACQSCHSDPTEPFIARYRFDPDGLGASMSGYVKSTLSALAISDMASFLGFPNGNDTDRLLNWGEDTYPQLLSPARQPTGQVLGYTYRYYPATGIYVGTKDGSVWYYDPRAPGTAILNLGTMRSFLDLMPNGR